ncbi:UNVERIFIED_CONTAM: hypothetical protein FKN15_013765 [Acipenser sinensis]
MHTRYPPKRVPSTARFFSLCRLTVQLPQSYSVGGQRSSGQLTGKPAGARPDYRGRWCEPNYKRLKLLQHSANYPLCPYQFRVVGLYTGKFPSTCTFSKYQVEVINEKRRPLLAYLPSIAMMFYS